MCPPPNTALTLIFDVETNGLLDTLTKVHCITIIDPLAGTQFDYNDQPGTQYPISDALARLSLATVLIGHNSQNFDLPALFKVYGIKFHGIIRDTMLLTRLLFPHVKDNDLKLFKQNRMPGNLIGRHSLKAWGFRLGKFKGDYDGGWEKWSQEMQDYMHQDGQVTLKLWKRCQAEAAKWGLDICDPVPAPRKDCIELEHRVAAICDRITEHGFRFNKGAAGELAGFLTAKIQGLEEGLQLQFPPVEVCETFLPKKSNKPRGYVAGVPFVKRKLVPFNPASRQDVGRRLVAMGWKPDAYGKDGNPTVDDEILTALAEKWPGVKDIAEYFTIQKLLGYISRGKESWMRHERKGRIHGSINSNGAHTGRATHSHPNMGQIPGCDAPYGKDCRSLFMADDGWVLVGVDASGLEARDLAGYMAAYDNGAYIEAVLNGDKSKGTDVHSVNAKLLKCKREVAKVFLYAMIYGAMNPKLGETLGASNSSAEEHGARGRKALMRGVPALGRLVELVQSTVEGRGFLIGLDGRHLVTRNKNAALNTLLQSAGAVQFKRSMVLFEDACNKAGFVWGRDYAICAWVHDEVQISCRPDIAEQIGAMMVQAIRDAGAFYKFACPLDGASAVGANWAETH